MKNIPLIEIQKNKATFQYFLNNKSILLDDIFDYLNENSIVVVHIVTIENDKKLLEAYFPYKNKKQFNKILFISSKAQIRT